jgi:hypothetical protein
MSGVPEEYPWINNPNPVHAYIWFPQVDQVQLI